MYWIYVSSQGFVNYNVIEVISLQSGTILKPVKLQCKPVLNPYLLLGPLILPFLAPFAPAITFLGLTQNIYTFRCPRGKVHVKMGMTAKLNPLTYFGPPLTYYKAYMMKNTIWILISLNILEKRLYLKHIVCTFFAHFTLHFQARPIFRFFFPYEGFPKNMPQCNDHGLLSAKAGGHGIALTN